jgi:hypothetical protein
MRIQKSFLNNKKSSFERRAALLVFARGGLPKTSVGDIFMVKETTEIPGSWSKSEGRARTLTPGCCFKVIHLDWDQRQLAPSHVEGDASYQRIRISDNREGSPIFNDSAQLSLIMDKIVNVSDLFEKAASIGGAVLKSGAGDDFFKFKFVFDTDSVNILLSGKDSSCVGYSESEEELTKLYPEDFNNVKTFLSAIKPEDNKGLLDSPEPLEDDDEDEELNF